MIRFIMCILLCVSLSGCASIHDTFWKHDKAEPIMVPVIVNPPKPPKDAFVTPKLPIETITEADTPDKIAKKYVASIIILKSFIRQLQAYLEVYNGFNQDEN